MPPGHGLAILEERHGRLPLSISTAASLLLLTRPLLLLTLFQCFGVLFNLLLRWLARGASALFEPRWHMHV